MVIVKSKYRDHYSKAQSRAPAYSQVLSHTQMHSLLEQTPSVNLWWRPLPASASWMTIAGVSDHRIRPTRKLSPTLCSPQNAPLLHAEESNWKTQNTCKRKSCKTVQLWIVARIIVSQQVRFVNSLFSLITCHDPKFYSGLCTTPSGP